MFTREDYVEGVAAVLRGYAAAEDASVAADEAKARAYKANQEADAAAFHLLEVSDAMRFSVEEAYEAMREGRERSGLPPDHWTDVLLERVISEDAEILKASRALFN